MAAQLGSGREETVLRGQDLCLFSLALRASPSPGDSQHSNTSQVKGKARSEACSLSRSFNNGFGFFSSVCSFIFFVGT